MNTYNENYYAVIMAGGIGSRFWPVSTSKYPKQFQDMMGVGETLLQLTFKRFSNIIPYENILISTNEAYKDIVKEQLPQITEDQILLEPVMRNTAPCLLLAALKIAKKNKDAVMIVAPSDHWIQNKDAFIKDVHFAFEKASKEDILITFGLKPTFPNTGFGYIQFEEEKSKEDNLCKALKFTEKPTLRNAKKYLEEGNYLWNSGIFIWKASFLVASFEAHLPEMYRLFENGMNHLNEPGEDAFIKESYPKSQNISIDYAILEKSEDVYVVPAAFDWDDLGTWGALFNKLAKDEQKNAVVNTQLMPVESSNNLVYNSEHKIVVVDGLKDYIIVNDKDVLLIVPKEKEQDIKEIRANAMKNTEITWAENEEQRKYWE